MLAMQQGYSTVMHAEAGFYGEPWGGLLLESDFLRVSSALRMRLFGVRPSCHPASCATPIQAALVKWPSALFQFTLLQRPWDHGLIIYKNHPARGGLLTPASCALTLAVNRSSGVAVFVWEAGPRRLLTYQLFSQGESRQLRRLSFPSTPTYPPFPLSRLPSNRRSWRVVSSCLMLYLPLGIWRLPSGWPVDLSLSVSFRPFLTLHFARFSFDSAPLFYPCRSAYPSLAFQSCFTNKIRLSAYEFPSQDYPLRSQGGQSSGFLTAPCVYRIMLVAHPVAPPSIPISFDLPFVVFLLLCCRVRRAECASKPRSQGR